MKSVLRTTIMLFTFIPCLYGQTTISSLADNYSNLSFSTSDYNVMRNSSTSKHAQSKVELLEDNPFIDELETTWPNGSWGRGYTPEEGDWGTLVAEDFVYPTDGDYAGTHPLYRATSRFGRGHINSYVNYTHSTDLDFSRHTINYLVNSIEPSGGYRIWYFRPSQFSANDDDSYTDGNHLDIYPTAHALRTLCEYYLSGFTYRKVDVFLTIHKAADWLSNIDWEMYVPYLNESGQNANNHGLAAWALSLAYKVTEDCRHLDAIRSICSNLNNAQYRSSTSDEDGLWKTGKLDTISSSGEPLAFAYHDTKIFYHCMALRGIVEAYEVLSGDDVALKANTLESIKRATNHIIEHRIDSTSGSSIHTLHLWWRSEGGADISGYQYFDGAPGEIFEPLILLTHNAHFSNEYSATEKDNLIDLVNKIGLNLDPNKDGHFSCIAYYDRYMNAINSGSPVYNWVPPYSYNVDEIEGTTVSGDFDHDGEEDDIAAFYYYGNGETRIHVWCSDGSKLVYQGSEGWWKSQSWYDANEIRWKVVSGDFDRDDIKDDIAVFYDYGGSTSTIHVFKSTGSEFEYTGSNGWWPGIGYPSSGFEGRVVSGDFDRDGYHDDIATLYYYGSGTTRIHTWQSDGNSFVYQSSTGWWNPSGYYNANKTTKRFVSGDFDNDGIEDDLAAFYDYGNDNIRIHTWQSNGNSFVYQSSTGWWDESGYDANKITGRVVSGDFDHDGIENDIVAFYDYGNGVTRAHTWESNGADFIYQSSLGYWSASSWFDANKITGRVVSGDFNNDHKIGFWSWEQERVDDIIAFYQMPLPEGDKASTWLNTVGSLEYQGSVGWWPCNYPVKTQIGESGSADSQNENNIIIEDDKLKVYPNPFSDYINLELKNADGNSHMYIYDIQGQLLVSKIISSGDQIVKINTNHWPNGIYVIMYNSKRIKVVK